MESAGRRGRMSPFLLHFLAHYSSCLLAHLPSCAIAVSPPLLVLHASFSWHPCPQLPFPLSHIAPPASLSIPSFVWPLPPPISPTSSPIFLRPLPFGQCSLLLLSPICLHTYFFMLPAVWSLPAPLHPASTVSFSRSRLPVVIAPSSSSQRLTQCSPRPS